ncbi:MAG: choice-of-anchor I family protein [Leptospira sp.]|nr:choice-of-anchor I family protein [Leptospira sp.]
MPVSKIIYFFYILSCILFLNCSHKEDDLGLLFGLALATNNGPCSPGSGNYNLGDDREPLSIELKYLGSYRNNHFQRSSLGSAATKTAYSPGRKRMFVADANRNRLQIISIADPKNPLDIETRGLGRYGDSPTSVDAKNGFVAVSVVQEVPQRSGRVAIFDELGVRITDFAVGSFPVDVKFSPDGCKLVIANKGEANNNYTWDPEGSITVVDLSQGFRVIESKVQTLNFRGFSKQTLIDKGVKLNGPFNPSPAQDLSPQTVAISEDSRIAWVSLQENNAIAIVDLVNGQIFDVQGLGYKSWASGEAFAGAGFDPTDRGNATDASASPRCAENEAGINCITIGNYNIKSMYQPFGLASFTREGRTFLLTANQGANRRFRTELDGFTSNRITYYDENVRIRDYCPGGELHSQFPIPASNPLCDTGAVNPLLDNQRLGRLRVVKDFAEPNPNNSSEFQNLYAFGARSISIRNPDLGLIWDSGSDIEQMLAGSKFSGDRPGVGITPFRTTSPSPFFNSGNEFMSIDSESVTSGPEPRGIAVGKIGNKVFSFTSLHTTGGVLGYDVTNVTNPIFQSYHNSRNGLIRAANGRLRDCPEIDSDGSYSFNGACYTTITTLEDTIAEVEVNRRAGDLGLDNIVFIPRNQSPINKDMILVTGQKSGSVGIYEIEVNQ